METKMKIYKLYVFLLLAILFTFETKLAQKNWAYEFDGVDDQGTAAGAYSVENNFSVETWVYLIGAQNQNETITPILHQVTGGTEDYALYVEGGVANFRLGNMEANYKRG